MACIAFFNPWGPGIDFLTVLLVQWRTCQSCNRVPQLSKLWKSHLSTRGIFLSRHHSFKPWVDPWSFVWCSVCFVVKHHYTSPRWSNYVPLHISDKTVCLLSCERGKQQKKGHSCLSAWVIHCKPSLTSQLSTERRAWEQLHRKWRTSCWQVSHCHIHFGTSLSGDRFLWTKLGLAGLKVLTNLKKINEIFVETDHNGLKCFYLHPRPCYQRHLDLSLNRLFYHIASYILLKITFPMKSRSSLMLLNHGIFL